MKRKSTKGTTKKGAAESDGLPMRKCRYCKVRFRPVRETQNFCQPSHRKMFHRYGGLSYEKMRDQIIKDVLGRIRSALALSDKCTKCRGGGECLGCARPGPHACCECKGAGFIATPLGAGIVAFLRAYAQAESRATIQQS